MARSRIDNAHLAYTCLASLLIVLALLVTACETGAVDGGTVAQTTTSTVSAPASATHQGSATTASSEDTTTSSFPVPVSASNEGPDWLGTTSTGTGPADLYCSVTFVAARPEGAVHVSLFSEAGELLDFRDGSPLSFKGLEPGRYRLGVFGVDTGYVSQWYGGLPVQGHDVLESQVLELQAGRNIVEFVLQPGLSIQGELFWTPGTPLSGYVQAYDLRQRSTGRGISIVVGVERPDLLQAGTGYPFLIVGLLPGRYRIGVSFGSAFGPPQVWDGGGSFEDAPVIDLTSGDVEGIRVDLGALPAIGTTAPSPTTSLP